MRKAVGFLWRATWFWVVAFSGAFLARTLYHWLVPTTSFAVRATVSTWLGVSTLFVVGFWAAWRSRSLFAGPLTAAVTSQIGAVMSVVGAAILLLIGHDPQTQQASIGSGGIEEVLLLPLMMIIPAVIVGSVGGAAASLGKRLLRVPSDPAKAGHYVPTGFVSSAGSAFIVRPVTRTRRARDRRRSRPTACRRRDTTSDLI